MLIPSQYKVDGHNKTYILTNFLKVFNKRFNSKFTKPPVPKPIGFNYKHIKSLNSSFLISEKTDGFRFFLFLSTLSDGTKYSCFISTTNDVYLISVHANIDYFKGTLFDGELVKCKAQANDQFEYYKNTYKIFDCYMFKGSSLINEVFTVRHTFTEHAINLTNYKVIYHDTYNTIAKFNENILKYVNCDKIIANINNTDMLVFEQKKWFLLNQLDVLEHLRINLNHKSDGIIFMDITKNVLQSIVYKWKEHHTIDLKYINKQFYIKTKTYLNIKNLRNYNIVIKKFNITINNNAIVECKVEYSSNTWNIYPYKIRSDKINPNYINTIKDTLNIIKNYVTLENIKNHIKNKHEIFQK
jgi:hypothetical protein